MALLAHNEWLESILADTSADPYAVKVIRNKPASLKDTCWEGDGHEARGAFHARPVVGVQHALPGVRTVRIAAGAPIGGDILKCSLKSIDFKKYAVTFTRDEERRLKAIFPHGVCDYTKPGVKQKPLEDTWLDFSEGAD